MGRPAKDLTGLQVGYWTVLYKVGTQNVWGKNQPIWHCRCICGLERDLPSSLIRSGGSRSCGCKTVELQQQHPRQIYKRKLLDLTGKRFGRLEVIELVEKDLWKVRCDCGTEKIIKGTNLRGGTQSCGCLIKDTASKKAFKDETGNKYGRLTVISRAYQDKKKQWYWNCVCECGNTTTVRGSHLRSGEVKSCMCLAHEIHLEKTMTHGLTYTQEYRNIQGRKRYWKEKYLDTEWDVEKERLIREMFPACIICGKTNEEHLQEFGSSLEVDHVLPLSKGHGLCVGNAVVLCKNCNREKHARSLNDLPLDWQASIILNAFKFKDVWDYSR